MTVTQRARGRVPLDQRSVLPTVAGVPWWGALVCASVAITLGYVVDSLAGSELTMFFSVMFFLGGVAAVLLVQNKSLFTAMVQPPLLLIVSVPLAYKTFAVGPTQGLKSLILDMALPLIDRFPTMAFTTLAVWIIGAFRLTGYIQERRSKQAGTRTRKTSAGADKPARRESAAAASRPGSGQRPSRQEAAPRSAPARSAAASPAATPPVRRGGDPRQSDGGRESASIPPVARQRRPAEDAPRTRSARGPRYADAQSPAAQPAPPTPRRRADAPRLPPLDEPTTGRRRSQQESVREFAERQGEVPRYRANRPERPRPDADTRDPKPDYPRLPNVRYRD